MKEYINKMWNQLKEDGIPLYLITLAVTGVAVVIYMLIVWLPSWLSPEQCTEVPSFGTPFFSWIIGVTGVFLVLFMTHALFEFIELLFSFNPKLPVNYSSMTWEEKDEYDTLMWKKKEKKLLIFYSFLFS